MKATSKFETSFTMSKYNCSCELEDLPERPTGENLFETNMQNREVE